MRRTLVVLLWLVATAGVVYVANAAVELVDLQVVPGGSRIEVLSLPEPSEPASTPTAAAATSTVPTTTVATPSIVLSEEVSTTVNTTTTTSTSVPATTTATPTATTTVAEAAERPTASVSTTTQAPAETPTTVALVPTTTTVALVPTTTAAPAPAETPTTVAPAETPTTVALVPTTTAVVVPELVVSTTSLAEARIGESYRADLVAVGGTPPYVWSLVVGSLPAGLAFSANGVLSGIPAAMAEVSLVFTVVDAEGQWADSPPFFFGTAPDRRSVVARGGSIFIDNVGDSISLFLVSPADGFSAVIVEPGGFRVEVQFVPLQGDATSFVVCEVNDGVVCEVG